MWSGYPFSRFFLLYIEYEFFILFPYVAPQKSDVVDNEVIQSIIQLFLEEDKPAR